MDRMTLAHWIDEGLKKPGKTTVGLGKALGIDRTGVSRMRSGERTIQAHELPIIEAYLGERAPGTVAPFQAPPSAIDEAALQRALEQVNEYLDRTGLELDAATYSRVVSHLYKLTSRSTTKPEELEAVTATVIDFAAASRSR